LASEQEHVARAIANEAYAKNISTVNMPDAAWKITVCFYAAVHYVEAIIVRTGKRSSSHDERLSAVAQLPQLKKIKAEYRALYGFSRDARYDPAINFGQRKDTQQICDLLPAIKSGLGF
jgi:hypothetical protein